MRCELNILPEEKAFYYFYRAKCHRFLNETEEQLECLLKGLDVLEEEDKLIRAKYYDELSILYRKNDVKIDKASEYINQAIAIKKINTIYLLQGKQLDSLEDNYIRIIQYRKK